MKKLLVLTLTLFVVSLSANSQPENSDQSDSDWTTYETKEFSLEYPEDWELNTTGVLGSSFFLFSPLTDILDDFKDNVSLIKEDVSAYGDISLEGYAEASKLQIKNLIKDSKIISEDYKEANGLTFYEMTYTGQQGAYDLIIQQRVWLIKGTAYVVTFNCKVGVPDEITTIGKQILDKMTINPDFESTAMMNDGEEFSSNDIKTYSADNFSIEYPNDWELDKERKFGMDLILYSPLSDENDAFRENVNMMTEDVSEYDISLEDYVDLSLSQIKKVITNGKIISSREKSRDGLTYYQVISEGQQGTLDLKFMQQYRIVDGKAYVLTLTCGVDTFDDYKKIGEAILNSFEIK